MLIPSSSHELMQFLCHRTDWKYETRREERPRIQRTVGEFIASHSGYEKSEYWRKIAEQSNDTPVGVILSSLLTFIVFLREKTQDPRIFSNDAVLYYEELRRRFPDLGFCSSPVEGLRLVRSTSVQYINTVKMTLDNCCAIGGKGTSPAHPSYSNDLARLEAASAPTARGYKLIALLYCMSESGQNLMPFLSSPAFEPNIALSVDGLHQRRAFAPKNRCWNLDDSFYAWCPKCKGDAFFALSAEGSWYFEKYLISQEMVDWCDSGKKEKLFHFNGIQGFNNAMLALNVNAGLPRNMVLARSFGSVELNEQIALNVLNNGKSVSDAFDEAFKSGEWQKKRVAKRKLPVLSDNLLRNKCTGKKLSELNFKDLHPEVAHYIGSPQPIMRNMRYKCDGASKHYEDLMRAIMDQLGGSTQIRNQKVNVSQRSSWIVEASKSIGGSLDATNKAGCFEKCHPSWRRCMRHICQSDGTVATARGILIRCLVENRILRPDNVSGVKDVEVPSHIMRYFQLPKREASYKPPEMPKPVVNAKNVASIALLKSHISKRHRMKAEFVLCIDGKTLNVNSMTDEQVELVDDARSKRQRIDMHAFNALGMSKAAP
eukprot:CAMPEP_0116031566 /NCGR_PEP_ID=MMETSP0321-20121206/17632_1 /TAXON_ID=163516 /ORGANISM="Leptocylindrus danicus var. danicus, Strain B650" /LENGTH=599 /DNA_ID=CAMNT_0003506799 /DNA_START=76 /DNA_END=1875 /DNA_ORIENTATION=-